MIKIFGKAIFFEKTVLFFYSITIFLGAFLLFQVQPMITKYILPFFGGSSSTWSVSIFFFTSLLFLGYTYPVILKRFNFEKQFLIHIIFLIVVFFLFLLLFKLWGLPITPPLEKIVQKKNWGAHIKVLFLLTISLALPYFVLSTTSSLLQYWFSQISTKAPYSFYSLSNFASFLSLLSYPFLIEPLLPLRKQFLFWSILFLIYELIFAINTIQFWGSKKGNVENNFKKEIFEKPNFNFYFYWIFLSALPVSLLISITQIFSLSIAPVPFVWLLPLSIYLISFVLTFKGKELSKFFSFLLIGLVFACFFTFKSPLNYWAPFTIILYNLTFFLSAMTCHAQLYKLKPDPNYLTQFYLCVSFGGVLGAFFNNFIAPIIFADFLEFPIVLFLILLILLFPLDKNLNLRGYWKDILKSFFPNRYFALIASFFIILVIFLPSSLLKEKTIKKIRNFYGNLRVVVDYDDENYRLKKFFHGNVLHGMQFVKKEYSLTPISYFSPSSGVGLVINYKRKVLSEKFPRPLKIGVVGLGVGTLAAYCQEGDYFRFYEIDPDVIKIAKEHFTFVSQCKGKVDIIEGDGRISLEQEKRKGERQNFDILIIDAFTSDSIPVHLLTKEALNLYLFHLKKDGFLVLQITNITLDLKPLVFSLAQDLNLKAVVYSQTIKTKATTPSDWAILSQDEDFFKMPIILKSGIYNLPNFKKIVWTDDFSNLLSVVKLKNVLK